MSMPWWQGPCRQPDTAAAEAARQRQTVLTKPSGSLGDLEVLAIQLAALQGTPRPLLQRTAIAVFAGDHGVVEEGVSAYPQAVTAEMVRNFVRGGAAISVLARQLDAALEVINLGTVTPLEALPGVIDLPLGRGTANFTLTPAMTHDQCQAALQAGRDAVLRACAGGADLFIGGEMGIGNTTAASAIASVLLDTSPLALAGPGTGLDADGVARKVAVIQRALLRHGDTLQDPYELLRRLGGFELAALTGAYLACAQQGLPTLVDGFICSVAALCAQHLQPDTRDWLLFAHCGAEPGHAAVLLALGGEPLLDLGLRLGEGSGAALAVPLLQLSCRLHSEMATFAEASVSSRAHD
ncbi:MULTISPECIES: nicotinate-nucleotide--dimethylbenzimidazole phosphoribosyltransferase [Pseudomonas]|uniref:nicotinate-nucleotide--dimethylbenzimidazole phosphoribosyltransferase n=1 Tax=Pseudomonas TaxID=286 RepID=UPI0007929E13|nr:MULTISPECIES: nicotinate-nucleotide--dimethylbenzimidazole phosphoribosyltransferase [Pseudomonas]KXJ30393.1 nicotinate-nucleotide--dimethylbenzimidazole phosphoribosyltransferase [Pseudomonas sp. HUK17]MCD4865625.1 nicotinate-nucleotide--dimethylbenzimidazole phosphoribosyltransferase [Pseudomonas sp. PLB05]MXS19062.1 nicotinate-nucleotide--dimethylbenzimidazole phosphoribosyltransferase [Pseudomonas oryzihabitans]NRH40409.1 nicotinate-nucleotide--dimethylbenzimidazole phosphoribosyltransfe